MFRFILLILIHLFLTLVLAAFLFVVLPQDGDYWGVALAQLWSLSVILLGDRAILSSLKAKRLGETNDLVQKISNLRALRRFERQVEVFSSRELADNILLIDSYFRSPVLVVGSEVVSKVREDDLGQLMSLAVERFSGGSWRYASVSAQLLSIFAAPMMLVAMVKIPKSFAALLSGPCDVITSIAWRIGMIKEEEAASIIQVRAAYPQLWGEIEPRMSPILSSFMTCLLKRFMLVQSDHGSFVTQIKHKSVSEFQ